MSNLTKNTLALKGVTLKTTVKRADQYLKDSRAGNHKVLKTEWSAFNRMLLGGFHFGQLYVVGGASGHGKSYLLTNIHRNILSKAVNPLSYDIRVLHFGFEMAAEMEFLRRVSAETGIPYRKLISSDDPLTDAEYKKVQSFYSKLQDDPIYFFEEPGTRYEIEATIRKFQAKFPDSKLVITLDHSLLVNNETGEDEIKTLSELGKMFIRLKKELGLLVIVLAQLNDKIEGERRRDPTNPALHFPTKTDIHGSKQLYHAADVVLVIHQPALLNLDYYGKTNIPTKGLVAIHQLKQRNGSQGYTLFDNKLNLGLLIPRKKVSSEEAKKELIAQLEKKSRKY